LLAVAAVIGQVPGVRVVELFAERASEGADEKAVERAVEGPERWEIGWAAERVRNEVTKILENTYLGLVRE
jgi:hypothetical protein